jgi:hypothetical protein
MGLNAARLVFQKFSLCVKGHHDSTKIIHIQKVLKQMLYLFAEDAHLETDHREHEKQQLKQGQALRAGARRGGALTWRP